MVASSQNLFKFKKFAREDLFFYLSRKERSNGQVTVKSR